MVASDLSGERGRKVVLVLHDYPDPNTAIFRAIQRANVANEHVLSRITSEISAEALQDLERPSLILIDPLGNPEGSLSAIRLIRSKPEWSFVPVICFQSGVEPAWIEQGYKDGATSIVFVPSDYQTFSEAIIQILMYWLLLNSHPK